MKHKTLSFLLALLMSMAANVASAYDFKVDGIYYNITSSEYKTVAITSWTNYYNSMYDKYKYTGEVVIPKSVTYNDVTYRVNVIGEGSFRNCTGLTSVTIPNSVIRICNYAFSRCI